MRGRTSMLFVVGAVGSVIGIALHVWLEPWTSAVALVLGAVAGVIASHLWGENLLTGLALGGAVTLLALGIRAFASILRTIDRPPSSPRVWFSR